MTKVWYLTKIQLLSFFDINKTLHVQDKKAKRGHLALSLVGILCIPILALASFAYSYLMATSFEEVGMLQLLPAIMMTATCLITLVTTLYKVNGILFGFKDYDMIMSLPIKTSLIVASRILLLYSMNLFFSLLIMVPAGVAYALKANPSPLFYVFYLVTLLLLPLIPIIIATFIGTLISIISSSFKHSNAIHLILTFAVLIGIMLISSSVGTLTENMAVIGLKLMGVLEMIYPLTRLYIRAVCDYNLIAFLLFIVISVLAFVLFVTLVGTRFKTINTALTSSTTNSHYKMTSQIQSSPFTALYKKELRRYFSSALYVTNTGFGIVLLTMMSFSLLFFNTEQLGQILEIPQFAAIIHALSPLVISIFIIMTCTTSCAISLEGKNLWILKSAPTPLKNIFLSKIAVNLTLTLPAILINSTLFLLFLKPDIMQSVLLFVSPTVYALFTALIGLLVNLKFPNLEWTTEVTAIKQSFSTLVTMFLGLISVAIPFGLIFALPKVNANLLIAGTTLMIAALCLPMYYYMNTKGEKLFRAL